MSGAEPIAVVSLVSSVASLAELITKIVSLIKELSGRHSGVADTLGAIQRECNIFQTALRQISAWQERDHKDGIHSDAQALQTAVDQYISTLGKFLAELSKVQSSCLDLAILVFKDTRMKALLGDARDQSQALHSLVTTMKLNRPPRQTSNDITAGLSPGSIAANIHGPRRP